MRINGQRLRIGYRAGTHHDIAGDISTALPAMEAYEYQQQTTRGLECTRASIDEQISTDNTNIQQPTPTTTGLCPRFYKHHTYHNGTHPPARPLQRQRAKRRKHDLDDSQRKDFPRVSYLPFSFPRPLPRPSQTFAIFAVFHLRFHLHCSERDPLTPAAPEVGAMPG